MQPGHRIACSFRWFAGDGGDRTDMSRIAFYRHAAAMLLVLWIPAAGGLSLGQGRNIPALRSPDTNPGDLFAVDNIVGNMRYVQVTAAGGNRALAVMETKVTQEMWSRFAAAAPDFAQDPIWDGNVTRGASYPLDCISWHYAIVFANLLSRINGLAPSYYADAGKNIPIDAAHFNNNSCWYRNGVTWCDLDFVYCDFDAGGYRLARNGEWDYLCRNAAGLGVKNLSESVPYANGGHPISTSLDEHVWEGSSLTLTCAPVEPSESPIGLMKYGGSCGSCVVEDNLEHWANIHGFTFRLVRTISPVITSLTTKYADPAYFLKGTPFSVLFTATVDWMGHPPGMVRFTTSKGDYTILTSGNVVSQRIDPGLEMETCAGVKAQAISFDESRSQEKTASGSVVPLPLAGFTFSPTDQGSGFRYTSTGSYRENLFGGGVGSTAIPANIPLFGGSSFNLGFNPELVATFSGSGRAEVHPVVGSAGSAVQVGFAGINFEISNPTVQVFRDVQPPCGYGSWDGKVEIGGLIEKNTTWPFPFQGIPVYMKVGFLVDAGGRLIVKDLNPIQYKSGEIYIRPAVSATAGVGVDRILSGEAWVVGGSDLTLQYPATPTLKRLWINLDVGIGVVAFSFEWAKELYHYSWLYPSAAVLTERTESFPGEEPRLISRDYLAAQGPFPSHSGIGEEKSSGSSTARLASSSLLQASVYPHSYPHLSTMGNKQGLVWVADQPGRTAINRTMTVFSAYNGSAWNSPISLGDDGSADFHPRLQGFADGAAIAVWEDAGKVFADSATLAELAAGMEISATVYQPALGQWSPRIRMTSNTWLDATPRISGQSKSDAMLVWIANPANDLRGKASMPNQLWFSRYNGTSWSTPAMAAVIPMAVFNYDFVYSQGSGYVVLGCDTDNDPATQNDRELYFLGYAGGSWGTLNRLTDDAVIDDHPQLVRTAGGANLLVWIRADGVFTSTNFNMGARQKILAESYSANLGNSVLSAYGEGQMSLTWSAPGVNGSDLVTMFYQPQSQAWGNPQRLTTDPETERYLTSVFIGRNDWMAVFNRGLLGTAATGRISRARPEDVPSLVATDLYMVRHALIQSVFLPQIVK